MGTNPLHKLQDVVVGTVKDAVKDPVGTAGKAVNQAKETVAVGRTVAGQVVTGVVGGVVGGVASGVAARVGRGKPDDAATTEPADASQSRESSEPTQSSQSSDEGSHPPAATKPAKPAKKPVSKAAPGSRPRVTKPPVTDVASKAVAERAKHQPVPEPSTGPVNPIDAKADPASVDATPTDLAAKTSVKPPRTVKKSPAKPVAPQTGTSAKKVAKKPVAKAAPASPSTPTSAPTSAPATPATGSVPAGTAKKAARKTSPRKAATPSGSLPVPGSAAGKDPLSAEELAAGAGTETITPVGTRGANVATNPDTTDHDLQQPDTAPLLDTGTAKAVRSESQTLSKAARTKKS